MQDAEIRPRKRGKFTPLLGLICGNTAGGYKLATTAMALRWCGVINAEPCQAEPVGHGDATARYTGMVRSSQGDVGRRSPVNPGVSLCDSAIKSGSSLAAKAYVS